MQFSSIDGTLLGATTPARVDQRAIAMMAINLTIRLFSVISRTLILWGGSYHSAETLLVYSTAQADWATKD